MDHAPPEADAEDPETHLDSIVRQDALTLSGQLAAMRAKLFPPRSGLTPNWDPWVMRELASLEVGRDAEEASHGGADHRAVAAG